MSDHLVMKILLPFHAVQNPLLDSLLVNQLSLQQQGYVIKFVHYLVPG